MTNRTDIQAAIDALKAKQGVANSITPTNLGDDQFQIVLNNALLSDEVATIKLVKTADDFGTPTSPDPSIGVIQLADNTRYVIDGEVVVNYPLQYGINSVVTGSDSLLDILVYTGIRSGLQATGQFLSFKNCSYVVPSGTAYSKTGGGGFIVNGVVHQVKNFGSIESDGDMIINGGLIFLSGTGVVITNNVTNSFFGIAETRIVNSNTADPMVDYRGSSINTVLIRNCEFVPSGGGVVVAGDAGSGNIGISADFSTNSFVLALAQQPFIGITTGDVRYFFNGNIGIGDSVLLGSALLSGNATTTTITTSGTFVSIGGTFTSGAFDQRTLVQASGGRIDNLSGEVVICSLALVGTCDNQGGGVQTFKFVFFKNGVEVPNYSTSINVDGNDQNTFQLIANIELAPGEFIEPKVSNETGTQDCLIESCQFIVRGDV